MEEGCAKYQTSMDYKAVDLRSEFSCSFSIVSPEIPCSEFYGGSSSWDGVFSS